MTKCADLLLLSHLNMELEMTAKLEIEPKVNFRAYVRDGHLRPADYEEGAVLVLTNAAPYPVAPQPQRAAPGIQNNNNHIININTNPSPFGTEVLELAGAVAGAALATANGTGGSAVAIGARALRRDFVATNIAVPSSHSPQQDSNTSPTITPRRGVDQGQYRLPPFQRNQEQARHAQAAAARRVSRQGSRYNPLARR